VPAKTSLKLKIVLLTNSVTNIVIYAPKVKFGTDEYVSISHAIRNRFQEKHSLLTTSTARVKKPPQVGNGLFDWIKPVLHTDDDALLEKVGFDAFMFLRVLRILRQLLYIMTFIGVCGLIPINIIATSRTG
jgi:hypothetical protein